MKGVRPKGGAFFGARVDPNSMRSRAKAAGIAPATVVRRMKKGMTLEEALAAPVVPRSERGNPGVRGMTRREGAYQQTGGKAEPSENQRFVDSLRGVLKLDPLYGAPETDEWWAAWPTAHRLGRRVMPCLESDFAVDGMTRSRR